jgi:integrase
MRRQAIIPRNASRKVTRDASIDIAPTDLPNEPFNEPFSESLNDASSYAPYSLEQAPNLAQAGQAANQAAANLAFEEYRANRPAHTLRAQQGDLANFSTFLLRVGVGDAPSGERLQSDPAAWQGITHGLVLAYREWLMGEGYAIATVNRRLATVKTYAQLALESVPLDPNALDAVSEIQKIRGVRAFGHKNGRNRDAKRQEKGTPTRVGAKKPYKAVMLSPQQALTLKQQPDTPQGRRDALLMCLLLDHGLRCGEVAALNVNDFDLRQGVLHFYRPKVDKEQTHKLTSDTLLALMAWIHSGDAPTHGRILRRSLKGGTLAAADGAGMSDRAITARVRELGLGLGIANLSAHDCRHYWATRATQQGTHPRALQQAGGWNSPAMVMRYIDETDIANAGVNL